MGVGIEDSRARARRRDQPAQDGGDLLGIDRKLQVLVVWHRGDALAGLQFEQLLRIDSDRIRIDRCGGRNRAGDDLALRQQAFGAGVDQAFAKLVEIEDAADEHHQRDQVEKQDASRQARKHGIAEDAADQREGMRPTAASNATGAHALRIVQIPFLHQLCQ